MKVNVEKCFENLVAFIVYMQHDGGLLTKSPDYIKKKFLRCIDSPKEFLAQCMDSENQRLFNEYMDRWLMKGVKVFDNGGITIDRYTMIINGSVFTMSQNAMSPQTVNQYVCEESELSMDGIGKEVKYNELSDEIKKAVRERSRECLYGIWSKDGI